MNQISPPKSKQTHTKKIRSWALRLFDLAKILILIMMVGFIIYLFILTIFIVSGPSMEPNFQDKNLLLINRTSYWFSEPQRGDVVVFYFPGEEKSKYIKRIIGLPGELVEIKEGYYYINGQKLTESYLPQPVTQTLIPDHYKWQVGENEYFVSGDNRENSNDSRVWGPLPRKEIIGKAFYRLLPTYEFGKIVE